MKDLKCPGAFKLAGFVWMIVAIISLSGCASDIKLGVTTNQAPKAPEEVPH